MTKNYYYCPSCKSLAVTVVHTAPDREIFYDDDIAMFTRKLVCKCKDCDRLFDVKECWDIAGYIV